MYEAHITGNKIEKVDSRTIRTYQSGAIFQGEELNLGPTLEVISVSWTMFIMLKLVQQKKILSCI